MGDAAVENTTITFDLLLKWYLVGLTSLIPIVNPFSTIPLMLSLTRGMSAQERNRQATRAALYSAIMMEGTLVAGSAVLAFFNVSVPALRIAGGMVVAFLGFRMLFPSPASETDQAGPQSRNARQDYSLIPLAFPSLCGAGTMALLISYSSTIESRAPSLAVKLAAHGTGLAVIATVGLLSLVLLRSASAVSKKLGDAGMEAIARIMGLLMVCIGVQFVAHGVREFAAMPL